MAVKLVWMTVYTAWALLAVFGSYDWSPLWVGLMLASLLARTVDL